MAAEFVTSVLNCARDQQTRRELASVLRMWSGTRQYIRVQRDTRPADAADLLRDAGTSRTDAVRIMVERFGLSARHCRRIVGRAYGPPDTP